MSQSLWGYWMIALGIGVITIMMLVTNYTTINQEDYYLLKEVTQASMYDAIDYNHYRQYGELKINREKFIENFERRFSESAKGNKNYKTDFYSIYETPPKVSVRVTTKTGSYEVSGNGMQLDVTNDIDAILENDSTHTITRIFYSVPYGPCNKEEQDALGYCTISNSPTLSSAGIIDFIKKEIYNETGKIVDEDNIDIISARYVGRMTKQEDWDKYAEQFTSTYGGDINDVKGGANQDKHKTLDKLIAKDLIDVKVTVTSDKVLSWTGKFTCPVEEGYGYSSDATNTEGGSIAGWCLLGIKYEIKFSYSY